MKTYRIVQHKTGNWTTYWVERKYWLGWIAVVSFYSMDDADNYIASRRTVKEIIKTVTV